MLEVQKYLINLDGNQSQRLETLKRDYGIISRTYPNRDLVLLDYDQIDHGLLGSKAHPIVRECRSLILSLSTFGVVSRKFERFFNYGEVPDFYADFCFDDCYAIEKADGSLIGIYKNPFDGNWEISTRGMAFAEGMHTAGEKPFREMVLDCFGFDDEDDFQKFSGMYLSPQYTYIFEYTSPLNRIVTPYKDDCMVMLSVIDNETGKDVDENIYLDYYTVFYESWYKVRTPDCYSVESIDEIINVANNLPGLQEGFVLKCRQTGKRMKVKSTNYLVAHKMRGNQDVPTKKNFLTAFFDGDLDELLTYFPEWKKYADPVVEKVDWFIATVGIAWDSIKHIEDQKEFAKLAKQYEFSALLFFAKKNKTHPKHEFYELALNKKLSYFGV